MRTLLILICACLFFANCARTASGNPTNELYVRAVLTRGERSKDSNSRTTTITVTPDGIVWELSFSGYRREAQPLRKKFKLMNADKVSLGELLSSNNLLAANTISLPLGNTNYRYFEISLDITLDGKKGATNIRAPSTAVKIKEEKLYRDSLRVVEELYRIMKRQEESMIFSDTDFD